MLKIAIVGKGGVGKTTIAGTLARLLAKEGFNVLAIDADPSLNLASAIGIPKEIADRAPILFNEEEFIKSRTQLFGGIINLTPKVDDVVDKFGITGPDGVKLLMLGTVKKGGTRCLCPENAFLRALLAHLILQRKDIVILDMVAGLEHLGRGTARGVDLMLCIVEPSIKAVEVAKRMHKLAMDIEVRNFAIIANKISSDEDKSFIMKHLSNMEILGFIPFDVSVMKADMYGKALIDYDPSSKALYSIIEIKDKILRGYMK